jgi:hypothetical protein
VSAEEDENQIDIHHKAGNCHDKMLRYEVEIGILSYIRAEKLVAEVNNKVHAKDELDNSDELRQ